MKRCALTLWLLGLAWLLGVGVAVTCADMPEQTGRVLGAISGLVALCGGIAGCVALCAEK
jgi:nitrate/nitrite transporter NarK